MKQLIFATKNMHKMEEIRMILKGEEVEVLSQTEAGIFLEVEENGESFEENAILKARGIAKSLTEPYKGAIVLADDSGLEIDVLDGEPGIYSARYMGEETSYEVKNKELLRRLTGVEGKERSARFVCAIAAVFPDGREEVVRGTMEGEISYEIAGENGFGYDPIFYLPQYGCTSAELTPEEKNSCSHRGEGLKKIKEVLGI